MGSRHRTRPARRTTERLALTNSLSAIERCRRLPRNAAGRDYLVGDLHGHRERLERELDRIGFDPHHDRLLSVGDLIDRGPDSLGTLSLIEEPWFHGVLGNHELMLLHYLGRYSSRVHSRKSFVARGGRWVAELGGAQRKRLKRLADALETLPLALHVEGEVPFNVMHGDLLPIGERQTDLHAHPTVCVHAADDATSSRLNLGEARAYGLSELAFSQHAVRISDRPFGDLELTYVGHTPVPYVTVHNSYVYIDQGAGANEARTAPTVLEHAPFAFWLKGAVAAREATRVFRFPEAALAAG
jgi:serine/threonine protein phosphatase 1